MTVENKPVEVEVGEIAPDFVARDLHDNQVSFRALVGGRIALLLFYRGGWCPFCNQQLAAIARDIQQFKDAGATIVAVSSEEVEKGKEFLKKLNLPFVLLSDTKFEGIDRYGVRDPSPHERLKAMGITQLSKPAAFVIDETGVVRYKYVGKIASDRPKNEDLLKVLGSI
jgi:peroxiredoxin